VPLGDLLGLAQLGAAMRKAQKAYFDHRKKFPGLSADTEYRAARAAEKRFDSALEDALSRDRQSLPGFGAEEGG